MKDPRRIDPTPMRAALLAEDLQPAPGSCPDDEAIWASAAGELDAAADKAIVLHLARCSECSSIWRLAREMLLADQGAGSSVVSIADRPRRRMWRRVLLPAAAAAVLIGVGLSTGLFLRNDPSPPVFREQSGEEKISAAPETRSLPRTACLLRWSAGPDGTIYDLTVTDGELDLVGTFKELKRPQFTVPPAAIPPSTEELLWRVTAHLPDGRSVSSETFSSTIERE